MKKALKRLSLGHHDGEADDGGDAQDRLPGITDNAAFNTAALPDPEPDARSRKQKVKDKVQSIAHVVKHPRDAAQEHATKQLAVNERPWLRDQADADQELFDAHDALDAVQDKLTGAPTRDHDEEEVRRAVEHTGRVERDRQELEVAWHLSRFVRRARVVHRPLAYPRSVRYRRYDERGEYKSFEWMKWIGHLVLYACQDASLHYIEPTNDVPYDRELLTSTIERLLVASGAFQLWWMRVRRVYTWEDPWLTFKWFLLFLALLKTGYFMSAYWAYLLYSVVTNFYGKHSRHWMKESHHRTTRTQERAAMFSELIIRHGPDAWLDPLLNELGPWLQLQLGDVADFLEAASSYYDWRNVSSTTATSVVYAALLAVSAIPDLEYSIKVFWLACGLYFFVSRPVATLYPRFRHVMDPMRWMYWDSPTTTESAFAYLQRQAGSSLHQLNQTTSDDAISDDDSDNEWFFDCRSIPPTTPASTAWQSPFSSRNDPITSFPARWSGRLGRLCISRFTLSFVPSTSSRHSSTPKSRTAWERPYSSLLEVRKTTRPANRLPSSKHRPAALSILWALPGDSLDVPGLSSTEEQPNDSAHCEEELLYGMSEDRRNEAFNAIIGVSGVLWMELQPEASWQGRMH